MSVKIEATYAKVYCMHLPNSSAMNRIWHKINSYVSYNRFDFEVSIYQTRKTVGGTSVLTKQNIYT